MKKFAWIFALAALPLTGYCDVDVIHGTGLNGPGTTDPYWTIVAAPGFFTGTPGSTTPYAAYVPSTSGAPGVWAGGNSGFSSPTSPGTVNYWIAAENSFSSLQSGTYSWIAAQTFTITTAGAYDINFLGTGDDTLAFFIDGQISYANTDIPTITGGIQLSATVAYPGGSGLPVGAGPYTQSADTRAIFDFSGTLELTAGTHTAYALVTDSSFDDGALITESTFAPSTVPEPSSYVLMLFAGAIIGAGKKYAAAKR